MLRDNPKIVTAPTLEPVTLAEAKSFLRIDTTADDAYITDLITASREAIENALRRTLLTTTVKLTKPYFPSGNFQRENVDSALGTSFNSIYEAEGQFYDIGASEIYLPFGFVQSVSSVKYTDDAQVETTFSSANYFLNKEEKLTLADGEGWVGNGNIAFVEIEYITGWTTVALVPKIIKNAVLVLIDNMYSSRGCDCAVPASMRATLKPYTLPFYQRPKTISVQRG
tara:strand:- start:772 stop:1449 length:678 start_codon:yes stop_codon:yes gene_type:complete